MHRFGFDDFIFNLIVHKLYLDEALKLLCCERLVKNYVYKARKRNLGFVELSSPAISCSFVYADVI